ncbi:MAG: NYN domain-containing protein [Desulfomonilaceae bacterium]
MIIIIDGNNLIGQKIKSSSWATLRKNLVLKMVKYVAKTRKKVKIVFDGVEDNLCPDGAAFKGVKIFYAKAGHSADDRIKDMVRTASYSRDITVVSSDRELRSCVSSFGAKVISREAFRSELSQIDSIAENETKDPNPKIEDVSEWLEFFGINNRDKI